VKCFCKYLVFFQAPQYWCYEHSNNCFWLMEFVFIIKSMPNLLKIDIIVGDTFGIFFQVQMIWHKLFWEAKGRLKMHMKKTKHYYKMCFSSFWVSLNLSEFGHFYLVKLFNPLVNGDQLLGTINCFTRKKVTLQWNTNLSNHSLTS
jgi:hypothetical protein